MQVTGKKNKYTFEEVTASLSLLNFFTFAI